MAQSSSDGEEEVGENTEQQAAERGNITALMMTTSLTRRDRRVLGHDRPSRESEPEPEPESLMTGRSSHSSSSSRRSSASHHSKISVDSEAEEVKAKLDAVNE